MALSNPISTYRPLLVFMILLLLATPSITKAQTKTGSPADAAATASPTASPTATPSPSPSPSTTASPSTNATASSDVKAKLLDSIWYPLVVSVIFIGLLLGFAATIIRVILRSKSSFRSPLGLPDGSLRAVLAFLLVAFLGFYVYESVMSLSDLKFPESLLGIVATVVGFYFGSRSAEEKGTKPQVGQIEGTVVDDTGAAAAGATVDLSQAGVKKLPKKTDAKGKFSFADVPIGEYDIQASLTGKTPSDPQKVKVTAGDTQTVNLKLKP